LSKSSSQPSLFIAFSSAATGVIIGICFIHILPEAIANLEVAFAGEEYPFGFLIMMSTILFTFFLETEVNALVCRYTGHAHHHHHGTVHDTSSQKALPAEMSPKLDLVDQHAEIDHVDSHKNEPGLSSTNPILMVVDRTRQLVMAYVLEVGIALHSVIIGIAFGASTQLEVLEPLTVALCFHQMLEGFGLGAAIMEAKISDQLQKWGLIILFCTTTPLGVAIGIGISASYDEEATSTALIQGVLEAIAGGVLIYLSLVDLMANMFKEKVSVGQERFISYFSMIAGAGVMSLIGLWA